MKNMLIMFVIDGARMSANFFTIQVGAGSSEHCLHEADLMDVAMKTAMKTME